METPPGPTRSPAAMRTMPRINWPWTICTMPTTTRMAAMIHSTVAFMAAGVPPDRPLDPRRSARRLDVDVEHDRPVAGERPRSIVPRAEPPASELGSQLALEEPEEAVLVGADLAHVDLVEAGVDVAADRFEVPLGIGTARDRFGDLVLGDERGRLLEVRRHRELLCQAALETLVGPALVRHATRGRLVVGPRHLQARHGQP